MKNVSPFTGRAETTSTDALAAIQLLDLFRDPDRDIDRIVEFISNDPALTAETLRRCNNGLFWGVGADDRYFRRGKPPGILRAIRHHCRRDWLAHAFAGCARHAKSGWIPGGSGSFF
jgi:hypothetical protein